MAKPSLLFTVAAVCLFSAPTVGAQDLSKELVVDGFIQPVALTYSPGDSSRLFVAEQAGRVRVIRNGVVLPTPFLDLAGTLSLGGERGLLGLAFHPDYASNGRLFVSLTGLAGESRVVEYRVSPNPDLAFAAAIQTIVEVPQPFSNNNGGCIAFGPDGMLFVGLGDGGGANDPLNHAQDPSSLLGKLLRLDVDLPAPFVPPDNPFVGDPLVRDEIWLSGVRNPWRFSFDSLTGDLWLGDVGQAQREEIHFLEAASAGGQNLGWRCMEGLHCTGLTGCVCNSVSLTLPIHDYDHSGGNCAVTGGVVHRSSEITPLMGTYFFADFCSSRVWSMRYDGSTITEFVDRTGQLSGNVDLITSFGSDEAGNVYLVEADGQIWKVVLDCSSPVGSPYCTGAPNSSTAFGASIGWFGSASLAANNFVLASGNAIEGEFGYFIFGGEPQQTPVGNGFLCIGPGALGLWRLLPAQQVGAFGSLTLQVDFTTFPASQIPAGQVTYFQFWYRDPAGGPPSTFNFSNGTSVLFCP